MISNSDFEKAWFLYKTEYEPQNISINDFSSQSAWHALQGSSYI